MPMAKCHGDTKTMMRGMGMRGTKKEMTRQRDGKDDEDDNNNEGDSEGDNDGNTAAAALPCVDTTMMTMP